MSSRRLYHVSPFELSDTIWLNGIDPAFGEGRHKVIWLVTQKNILWAIGHVARKKRIAIENLTVFTVKASERQLIKSSWRGIWQFPLVIHPVDEVPAVYILDKFRVQLLRKVGV